MQDCHFIAVLEPDAELHKVAADLLRSDPVAVDTEGHPAEIRERSLPRWKLTWGLFGERRRSSDVGIPLRDLLFDHRDFLVKLLPLCFEERPLLERVVQLLPKRVQIDECQRLAYSMYNNISTSNLYINSRWRRKGEFRGRIPAWRAAG
jgi:hypothetical protein